MQVCVCVWQRHCISLCVCVCTYVSTHLYIILLCRCIQYTVCRTHASRNTIGEMIKWKSRRGPRRVERKSNGVGDDGRPEAEMREREREWVNERERKRKRQFFNRETYAQRPLSSTVGGVSPNSTITERAFPPWPCDRPVKIIIFSSVLEFGNRKKRNS